MATIITRKQVVIMQNGQINSLHVVKLWYMST